VSHVALVFVEQAVKADGGVVLGRAAERAEAEAGIESGFAHGAIAAIEAGAETMTIDVRRSADFGGGDVATCFGEFGGLSGCGIVGSFDQVVGVDAGVGEQPTNDVGIVGAVVCHFGNRASADIEVTCEAGVSGEMRFGDPDVVVTFGIAVGAGKPGSCDGLACRVLVELANHRGEEGRLRAGEVIGAIGVEDGAVVFDLEEKVLDHPASEIGAFVGDQAEYDEVAVPAVHLVEAAAWNDVGVGQIEQAFVWHVCDGDITHVEDFSWECADVKLALQLHGGDGGWSGHASG